jgi:dihydrofolate reductase
MRLSLIVAFSTNRAIGSDNKLPWRLSGDLRRFKEITIGKPIVMGRKTFESIGRPLPGRTNIVMTRDLGYSAHGVTLVSDFTDAVAAGKIAAEKAAVDEIMVIGGASIYSEALPFAHRLYITEVHCEIEGDVTFPYINSADWIEISRNHCAAEPNETCDYSFVVYDRIAK